MKRLCLALLAIIAFPRFADAADLPSNKDAGAAAATPDCFSSFWSYLNSSPENCPLSYAGFTLYGALDGGYGYSEHGAPLNPNADKVNYAIARNSNGALWQWSPNGLSTSAVGIRMKEDIADGWSLVGVVEAGINPFTGRLINGPKSQADNNLTKQANQDTNFGSSRAGQWDNSQGYIGVSNKDWGTVTLGRTNSLTQDTQSNYDPVGAVAFSMINFSALSAGFGAGQTVRLNEAVTYRLNYQNFRLAAQTQIGGYQQGNATTGQYQGQIGADFGNFSFDAIAGFARDAVHTSSFSGSPPAGYDPADVLKANISNNLGVELLASYKWDQVRFYGGFISAREMNPSDQFKNGLPTIADGIFVPAGYVTSNNYIVNRILNTTWTGAKWSVSSNLGLAAGFYIQWQPSYLPAPGVCAGSGINTSSSKCAGTRDAMSFMIDYKPTARIDIYAGMMVSQVTGGFASGFLYTRNVDPTVGLRVRF